MQTPENFRARKWNVQKEANGCIGKALPNHVRDKHEVIVVHPDYLDPR